MILIPLLYVMPALWMGALISVWLNWILIWGLSDLPPETILGMSSGATLVLIAGILLAMVGFFVGQWEVLYHRKAPYNIDAMAIYMGVIFALLAFLVSPTWPQWLGLCIGAILLGVHACIVQYRTTLKWTRTAMSTLSLIFAYLVVLGGWTYVTWIVM